MTPFKFIYTNHRGETAERTVIPLGVRFGSTQWHPEPQWLLRAFDLEKGAEREFAMAEIDEPPKAPDSPVKVSESLRLGAYTMNGETHHIIELHTGAAIAEIRRFLGTWTADDLHKLLTRISGRPRHALAAAAEEAAQWEGEVRAFLDQCPWTVRCCEGGGPEDLHGSLAITIGKMQALLKKVADAAIMLRFLDLADQRQRDAVITAAMECIPRGGIPLERKAAPKNDGAPT